MLSVKQMLKDLDQLQVSLEAHPDPFVRISQADFQAHLADTRAQLTEPLELLDFYKKMASIVALLKDGHSTVRLPEHWMDNQRKENGAFPYEVFLSNDGHLHVINSYNNGEIPRGAEIIALNGLSIAEFLDRVDPYISYERVSFRNTQIDNNFEKYLYLAFGQVNNLEVQYQSAETKSIQVSTMPFREWKKFQRKNQEDRESKIQSGHPYSYKQLEDGVGLITIYQFKVNDLLAYRTFLTKTFKRIEQNDLHSLIIDLRGNYGGWPKISAHLLQYIATKQFRTLAKASTRISKIYQENLYDRNPALRSIHTYVPPRRYYLDVHAILRGKDGTNINESEFFQEELIDLHYKFSGDCYLLINRDTYSAAACFAATFQCYQMGVIIGEQSGGTRVFHANPMFGILDRSRFPVTVSTTIWWTACYDEKLMGVSPDLQFTPTVLDLTTEADMQLMYTQRIIKRIRKQKELEKK